MIKLLDILEIENNLKANRNIVRVKGTDVSPLNTGDPIDYNAFKRGYKSIKTTSDPDTGQITTEFETLPKFDEIRRILLNHFNQK